VRFVNSFCLLVFALLALASCDELAKLDTTRAQPPAVASNQPEPAAIEAARAIELAKEARTIVAGRSYIKVPPEETLTNDFQIRVEMSKVKGDLNVLGWKAQKMSDDTYLVTYTYEVGGQSSGWPFEVKVSAGVVRPVVGDSVLEEKYGWSVAR